MKVLLGISITSQAVLCFALIMVEISAPMASSQLDPEVWDSGPKMNQPPRIPCFPTPGARRSSGGRTRAPSSHLNKSLSKVGRFSKPKYSLPSYI